MTWLFQNMAFAPRAIDFLACSTHNDSVDGTIYLLLVAGPRLKTKEVEYMKAKPSVEVDF